MPPVTEWPRRPRATQAGEPPRPFSASLESLNRASERPFRVRSIEVKFRGAPGPGPGHRWCPACRVPVTVRVTVLVVTRGSLGNSTAVPRRVAGTTQGPRQGLGGSQLVKAALTTAAIARFTEDTVALPVRLRLRLSFFSARAPARPVPVFPADSSRVTRGHRDGPRRAQASPGLHLNLTHRDSPPAHSGVMVKATPHGHGTRWPPAHRSGRWADIIAIVEPRS